jgi:hypothetical protein
MAEVELLFWMDILSPYRVEDVKEAFRIYVSTPGVEFLPRPGQIIGIIDQKRQERWRRENAHEENDRMQAARAKFIAEEPARALQFDIITQEQYDAIVATAGPVKPSAEAVQ